MTCITITAEEVPAWAEDRIMDATDRELCAEVVADILNRADVRALVIAKCVAGMSEEALDRLPRLLASADDNDVLAALLITALCGTPEEG